MKNKLIATVIALLVGLTVSAQETGVRTLPLIPVNQDQNAPRRQLTPAERLRQELETRQGKLENKRAENQGGSGGVAGQAETRQQLRQKQFAARAQMIVRRLQNAVLRIGNLLERAKSRMEKLAAAGVEVSTVRAKHAEAEAALQIAHDAVNVLAAKLTLTAADGMARPADFLAEARKLLDDSREKIKRAHALTVEVIKALRGAAPANTVGQETAP